MQKSLHPSAPWFIVEYMQFDNYSWDRNQVIDETHPRLMPELLNNLRSRFPLNADKPPDSYIEAPCKNWGPLSVLAEIDIQTLIPETEDLLVDPLSNV